MSKGTERRLAAILAGDVAGYSRLMGEDEATTLDALRHLRRELLGPAIADHRGTLVKSMGDGWLVEFASAADGVNCAIQVQEALADHELIKLRVGLHVGDVTFEDEDIYGDGVNIAARLQDLSAPGAIVISDTARRSIDGKMAADFNDLGPQELKNIDEPVIAYGWGMSEITDRTDVLALPEKPSIAVLPFDNMSNDPDQEYFADGMTEDIITALSHLRWLFVIARNSTFAYKGRAIDIKRVGSDLGVRYVLEGSVRKAGQRVRVTAQLIEADTGNHIWAERYDRDLVDIFDLQDELTQAICAQVDTELEDREREQARARPTEDLGAWEFYQRGMWYFHKYNAEDFANARGCIEQAISLDPNFSLAHAALSYWITHNKFNSWVVPQKNDDELTLRAARRAVVIDDKEPFAHCVLARAHAFRNELDAALSETERALELNPNLAAAHFVMAWVCVWTDQGQKAVEAANQALRLSPNDPTVWALESWKGHGYWIRGKSEEALIYFTKATRGAQASPLPHLGRAAALVDLGRLPEATAAISRALECNPESSVLKTRRMMAAARHSRKNDYLLNLRNAGLPEE